MRKLEPTVILLTGLLIFFTVAIFCAEWWFKSDAQFFQTIAAMATGMNGALLLRITGKSDLSNQVPPTVHPIPPPVAPVVAEPADPVK